ncbi:hypothetical protein GK047_09475 [Paenibacillus sp. SYP-B3998]|uniref:Lipoprotein n=1 Tax=Paenibacillus sp. SYP-B3998 TaxID=2678564 RepID=A0A6G3ZXE1_9BACL|nr:hypothetical protein [Paenibacillus sp. SYP-B3998]NEW06241.1 hypothetical protein [Paenibacillus sp. SYP-B3998]
MNLRFVVTVMAVLGLSILLTGCSIFGGGDKAQKKESTDQSKQKSQSTKDKPSVINQELKKQYDMYKEIIQYQIEQDKKVIKQSEERYKKLKEESDKPPKTEKKDSKSSADGKGEKSDQKMMKSKGSDTGSSSGD